MMHAKAYSPNNKSFEILYSLFILYIYVCICIYMLYIYIYINVKLYLRYNYQNRNTPNVKKIKLKLNILRRKSSDLRNRNGNHEQTKTNNCVSERSLILPIREWRRTRFGPYFDANVNQTCRSRGWRKSRRWSLDGIWVAGHNFTKHHTSCGDGTRSEGNTAPSQLVTDGVCRHSPRPRVVPEKKKKRGPTSGLRSSPRSRTERDFRPCAIDLLCGRQSSVRRRAVSMKNTQDRINSARSQGRRRRRLR